MRIAGLALALTGCMNAVAAADAGWSAPRNAFGQPDLQGVWTNSTLTTLERPGTFDSLTISAEEAHAFEKRTNGFFESIDELPEGELEAGGDVGGYNSFWMDPGTQMMQVAGEYRSSILVEPDDGNLPYRIGARVKTFDFLRRIGSAFDGPEQRPLGERCIV
jgi:hypothetical protein